jgi:hypothetical protein
MMAKEISKRFVLALTADLSKTVTIIGMRGDAVEESEKPIRDIEIVMLTGLFETAANFQKGFKESMQCLDCIGHMENLKADENEIVLTQSDLDFLKVGWDKTAEHRPGAWNKCRDLLAQLVDPKEYVEPTPEPEAAK